MDHALRRVRGIAIALQEHAKTTRYVDDLSLDCVGEYYKKELQRDANKNLNHIDIVENGLLLATQKTKSLIIVRKRKMGV